VVWKLLRIIWGTPITGDNDQKENRMQSPLTALCVAAVVITCASLAGPIAHATPVPFFGEDLNPGGDPNTLSAFPNSIAARNDFFSNLVGVGTETFDSIGIGTASPTVTFNVPSGTIQATLNGGTVATGSNGAGSYPISASNYLFAGTSSFTVTFDTPIAAFGFFGTDISDSGGSLTLTLIDAANNISTVTVPAQQGNCGGTPCSSPTSGSVLYYGFFDTGDTYSSIAFNNSSTVDNFGFDNFSVGSVAQIVPTPEPASAALLGAALVGLSLARLRRV
jgi:hypothetical protein